MNNQRKVGVVVLNYINYKYTIECVRSFLKQENVNLEIVIIDNGSKNRSYYILSNYFKGFKNIEIIKSKDNKGYAKGNNIGIKYLRKLNINFIILANSDTKVMNNNVVNNLLNMYAPNTAVISPNIKNMDGSNDLYVAYEKKYLKLRLIKACFQSIFWKKGKSRKALLKKDKTNTKKIKDTTKVIGLTGSFYMLTPSFFKYYEKLYDKTFLYFEENAMIECLRKRKLSSKKSNCEETLVLHEGAASSSRMLRNIDEKKRLMSKSAIKVLCFIVFG